MRISGRGGKSIRQKLEPWFLLALVLIVGWFVLTSNLSLPKFDELAERDLLTVYERERILELQQQFPGMPAQEQDDLVSREIEELKNKPEFQELVAQTAEEYKDTFRDPNGEMYLTHIDSYNYYRQAENVLEHGHVGTRTVRSVKRSVDFFGLRLTLYQRYTYDAVKQGHGAVVGPNFLPYLFVGLYKAFSFFQEEATLVTAATWYPVLFGLLSLFIVFLIGTKLSNRYGGFLATLFLALHPQFFSFHHAGLADTNALSIFFSLLTVYLFLQLIAFEKKWKTWLYLIALLLVIWLFKFAWGGYFYILIILFAFAVLSFVVKLSVDYRKHRSRRTLSFLFATIFFALVLFWKAQQSGMVQRALAYLNLGIGYSQPIVPVFPYISELTALSTGGVIAHLGGYTLLLLGIVSLVFLILRNRTLTSRTKYDLLLVIWLLALAVPAMRVRFLPFFLLPFALLLGIGMVELMDWLAKRWEAYRKHTFISHYAVTLVAIGLFSFALIPDLSKEIEKTVPIMDDSIYDTALQIQTKNIRNGITNVWWDSGYFYEAIADRPVLFNGASFDSLNSYWLSRVFTETDEEVAAGILRMLACKGADALPTLAKRIGYEVALQEMNSLLKENLTQASVRTMERDLSVIWKHHALGGIVEENILLNMTHCDTPAPFLVVSEDLLQKYWAFDYYSKLDFVTDPEQIPKRYDLITPAYNCNLVKEKAYCEYGFTVDLKQKRATDANGEKVSFLFYDGTQLIQPESDLRPDRKVMLLFHDNGRLRYVLIYPQMVHTMLVKLLIFGGEGLEHFEKLSDRSGKYAKKVVLYKVKFT